MKDIEMPKALHEVFGERQSWLSVCLILAGGLAGAAVFSGLYLAERAGQPIPGLLGLLPGMLLVFDVAAGSIANFSRGTSDFYAARPRHRLVFIAIHAHLPVIGWLLGLSLPPLLLVWLYTLAAAGLVNWLAGRPDQTFCAGALLALGLMLVMALPLDGAAARLIAALFLLKVQYAFAVDHYGQAARPGDRQ